MRIPSRNLAAPAIALLALALPGQQREDARPPESKERVVKLEAWPELKRQDRDILLGCIGQFRKQKAELHAGAHARLIAIGEPGIPLLFQKVSDRPNNINRHLFEVFDAVLKERHAALLARECKKSRVELRRYLIKRLTGFADRDMLPVLVATMKDSDEETAYYAALGAFALGERSALPIVLAYSKVHWNEVGQFTAEALAKARSRQAGSWVFEAIAKAPSADKMAGLRLARYVATKDHLPILRNHLDAPDHTIKKAAINALRVLHGEKALEKMSVFQTIEMAQEWQARL